ncbi:MAG: hypothetical protein V5A61_11430 [Haloarculaceae archaeon]|jgi:hypothetical protein
MTDDGSDGRRTKVVRVIDEYGLDGLGPEMERRWTATGEERMSLRTLATYFNRELLSAAMAEAGVRSLSGEVENVHRLLTDEDVSEADRTRARRRLEREGVDVGTLLEDFVSYQAIRTYLKEDRGAEYSADTGDRLETEAANVQRLQSRTTAVVESKLDQLRDAGHLSLGEFQTLVSARVVCEDCGSQYEVGELLDRGGCDCDP